MSAQTNHEVKLVDVSDDLLKKSRQNIETSLARVAKKRFAQDAAVSHQQTLKLFCMCAVWYDRVWHVLSLSHVVSSCVACVLCGMCVVWYDPVWHVCCVVSSCVACVLCGTVLPLLFKRWRVSRLWAWPHLIWRICMKCYKNSDRQLLGQLEIVL